MRLFFGMVISMQALIKKKRINTRRSGSKAVLVLSKSLYASYNIGMGLLYLKCLLSAIRPGPENRIRENRI